MRGILLASLDLDASIITLPMSGQSSPVSPKRRMSSRLFSRLPLCLLSSTPSTSVVIPPPVSHLSTPASDTTDKFVITFKPSPTFSVHSSCAMCEICNNNEQLRLWRTAVDERTNRKTSNEEVL
ncbi:hypothetical protein AHF37_09151 [Paragonimus kellicotti]|nr:hypothetical protein AHF37_09151 [Paragonimus kellicotti]